MSAAVGGMSGPTPSQLALASAATRVHERALPDTIGASVLLHRWQLAGRPQPELMNPPDWARIGFDPAIDGDA